MHKTISRRNGFTLVDVLLILAFVGIVASFILRIIFASELHELEDHFWRLLGIEPGLARFVVGSAVISLWIWMYTKRRKRVRNKKIEL
jgi:hypothetical protein